jgi:hypothetical protein
MNHVNVTTLFQPDVLVPLQYSEAIKRSDVSPEKDLMLALLGDAVYCFQKYLLVPDKRGKLFFREAERWIFDDDESGVFSYRSVCGVLGIDGGYLRCGLLRWKKKHLASWLKGRLCRIRRRHHVCRAK